MQIYCYYSSSRVTGLGFLCSVMGFLCSTPSRVTGSGFLNLVMGLLCSDPTQQFRLLRRLPVLPLGFLYSVMGFLCTSPSRVTGLGFLYSLMGFLCSDPTQQFRLLLRLSVLPLGFLYSVMGFLCSSPTRITGWGFLRSSLPRIILFFPQLRSNLAVSILIDRSTDCFLVCPSTTVGSWRISSSSPCESQCSTNLSFFHSLCIRRVCAYLPSNFPCRNQVKQLFMGLSRSVHEV